MFTKTSLNKIKKADLVQMYLDLQAKDYDEKMDKTLEKCCNKAVDEVIEGLKKQIEDLEDNLEEAFDQGWETGKSDTHDEIDLAVSAHVKRIEDLEDEMQKMSSMAYANGLDINPTEEDLGWLGLADEEEYEKKENDTIKEVMNDIINQVEEKEIKKEKLELKRKATMYQFMSEYMEKADCMGEYFDYIREYYPDERKAAGVLSDEED
tara:strand:+ start:47 stop:670 length:624 start_codon:yes stop_codon:yes gene_type:complete